MYQFTELRKAIFYQIIIKYHLIQIIQSNIVYTVVKILQQSYQVFWLLINHIMGSTILVSGARLKTGTAVLCFCPSLKMWLFHGCFMEHICHWGEPIGVGVTVIPCHTLFEYRTDVVTLCSVWSRHHLVIDKKCLLAGKWEWIMWVCVSVWVHWSGCMLGFLVILSV